MSLDAALRGLAGWRVLVALDFDGTLAHIVEHADQARPVAGAVEVLTRLSPVVEVAVISGRRLDDLRRFLGPPAGVVIVGEHGAAWDGVEVPTPERFAEVRAGLEAITGPVRGAWVEVKSTSLVVHTRQVEPAEEGPLADAIVAFLELEGLIPEHGKKVIDVTFVDTSKGSAVEQLRNELGVDRVMFAGDDTTDESVFTTLRPGDVGIRVGDQPTAAEFRVEGPEQVVEVLERLVWILEPPGAGRGAAGPGPPGPEVSGR